MDALVFKNSDELEVLLLKPSQRYRVQLLQLLVLAAKLSQLLLFSIEQIFQDKALFSWLACRFRQRRRCRRHRCLGRVNCRLAVQPILQLSDFGLQLLDKLLVGSIFLFDVALELAQHPLVLLVVFAVCQRCGWLLRFRSFRVESS